MILPLVAGLAAMGLASAQTPSSDLPPPPGTLERELSLSPESGTPPPAAQGGALNLANAVEIPFVLEDGHIIVQASIDGNPPMPFMFDTGARDIITPEVARTLNTTEVRSARIGGFGRQVSLADMVKVGQITIGDATLEDQVVSVLDIPNTLADRGARPRLAGFIGSELLAHYAVSIDYGRHTLILNNPGFYPSRATFSLPLDFAMSPEGLALPSVTAELDGAAGDFVIDTGGGTQVFVSQQFEQEHNPFAQYGKVLNFLSAGGIGGRAYVHLGFGKQLRLGPVTLSPPVVAGTTDMRGQGFSAGVLGAGILSQFIVTIDYQSSRAYFETIAGRKLPTILHGTGMEYDKPDHEAFEVLDVLPGSAAEQAGLQRGDRIVEVGGQPARDLSTSDVGHLSVFPAHKSLAVRTSDGRRFDLAIRQILP
ncbi:MAG: aspartyl protease family protein [Pseudomonadota bacterium]